MSSVVLKALNPNQPTKCIGPDFCFEHGSNFAGYFYSDLSVFLLFRTLNLYVLGQFSIISSYNHTTQT